LLDALHRSIVKDMPRDVYLPGLEVAENNPQQHIAIDKALRSSYSLIQGPPGIQISYLVISNVVLSSIM